MIDRTITQMPTTLTTGSWLGRERLDRIQIGSVSRSPAVNVVTITSSKLRAKAGGARPTSAEGSCGNVTYQKVCHVWAPRSAEASSNEPLVRRRRAMTLL